MTGKPPSPSPQAPPGPLEDATLGTISVPRKTRDHFRRPVALLRKLSVFAPLAAAYAAFQAVLSSLPPSLSLANVHYLLAIASALAVGALVGCGMLFARKSQLGVLAAAAAAARPLGRQADKSRAGTGGFNLLTASRMCYETMLDTVVTFDDPQLGRLTGWPHFLHEASAGFRPTAYGTAYGLKLALTLGSQDGRLDRAELAETLWKLRRADGGWASRTQGITGRPEVTAVALGALAAAGCDSARLAEAGDVFEAMLAPEADTIAMTSTFVVSSVVRELARIRPQSPRLARLRTILLNGTVQDPGHDSLLCWSTRLDRSGSGIPSAAHTAMAIVALTRVRQVSGDDNQLRSALAQAVRWLTLHKSLENQTEQIRRFVTADHWESLTVNLFTAAWVARALMGVDTTEIPGADSHLDEAIEYIIKSQNNGIWEWRDGNRPLWMTYQGISTVQAFALSHWTQA